MLKGTNITKILNANSLYLEVIDGENNQYQLPVDVVLQMVNEFEFPFTRIAGRKDITDAVLVNDTF